MKINNDAYYARLDADEQKRIDDASAWDDFVESIENEIIHDSELLYEAFERDEDAQVNLLILLGELRDAIRTDRTQISGSIVQVANRIDDIVLNVSNEYAPYVADQRANTKDEY